VACSAQVRAHGRAVPAVAQVAAAELHVRLDVPIRGVAPGQAVVLYDGDRVIGSATISSTDAAVRASSRS
jgi:tRNA-specific 2-thiouridylase